jgi:dienelactone hydrolase
MTMLNFKFLCFLACSGLSMLAFACGDDGTVQTGTATDGMTTTATDGMTTSETPGTMSGPPTTSAGETTFNCGDGIPACAGPMYPIEGAPFDVASELHVIDSTSICGGLDPSVPELLIQVFHPNPLPDFPLPFAILTNGAGQSYRGYEHILRPLAAMGFVAASVQSEKEVIRRANAMACTLRWLRSQWASSRCVTPNCDLVLIGHSRGGEAAWLLGHSLASVPWHDIAWQGVDVNLKALVGIAPRYQSASPYAPDKAVPYLGIMGATDDDIPGNAIIAYDNMVKEAERTATDPAKVLLWPYDVPHSAFGGNASIGPPVDPALTPSEYLAKGKAIASRVLKNDGVTTRRRAS